MTRKTLKLFAPIFFGFSLLALVLLGVNPRRGQAKPTGTYVSGPIIEDTTWDLAGSPYTLTNDVIVNSSVTLTIEAGVKVEASTQLAELRVLGRLVAIGTISQPITFTSSADSGPNEWGGIVFDGGAGHLDYATVRYGGSNSVQNGNITARNVTAGEVRIENSRILTASVPSAGSGSNGIYLFNSRMTISNTLVAGNGKQPNDYGVNVQDGNSTITVTGSTFQNNAAFPLKFHAPDINRVTGNSFSGNSPNRILIVDGYTPPGGILTTQTGLEGYEISDDISFFEKGPTVPANETLTIEPGVVIFGRAGTELLVLGHLEVPGTAAQPVTFTSSEDSGPDQWGGIFFDEGTGFINHATVRYAGRNITVQNVTAGEVRIENSEILTAVLTSQGSTSYGVYVLDSRVTLSGTLVAKTGKGAGDYNLYARGGSSVVTVTNSILADSPGRGIGIDFDMSQMYIQCTTITGNQGGGLWLGTSSHNSLSIIGSNISDNNLFGIENNTYNPTKVVEARYNWWGGAEGPFHATLNTNGLVDSQVNDNVNFEPWVEVGATCTPLLDLSVAKSGEPNPVLTGYPLTYTITVENDSPDNTGATGVVLTDTLPVEVSFVEASASQGNCNYQGGMVTCNLNSLSAGDGATVMITVTTQQSGTVTNLATVAMDGLDVVPSNNTTQTNTAILDNLNAPAILNLTPDELLQGFTNTLTIDGMNFNPGVSVTLSISGTGSDAEALAGKILSVFVDRILVEFGIIDPEFMGDWVLTVKNPDGYKAVSPLFINPTVVWIDYDWDGVRGFPIVPEGQERRNTLAMFNLGYSDGFALIDLTPPDPGTIRLKIGANPMGSVWDSTSDAFSVTVPMTVTLIVPIESGTELQVPLYWGVSPEDIDFGGGIRRPNDGLRPGQNRQLNMQSVKGAAKSQAKGMLVNAIINAACGNLKGQIESYYGQGGDTSILNNAVDAAMQEIKGLTDPKNVVKSVVNQLAGTPMPVSIAESIAKCAGELVNTFINSFQSYTDDLAYRICRDKKIEQEVIKKMSSQWRGRLSANRALIKAYSQPASKCRRARPRYSQTFTGQIRGPWDPNTKATYVTVFGCTPDAEDPSKCKEYHLPLSEVTQPITYVIQFENKKEATDPAVTVVITDLLDSNLDPGTLRVIAISPLTSTVPTMTFSTAITDQLVTFQFKDINLPPNKTSPEGEGYVIYAVHPRDNIPLGTRIRNQAYITFDFNPAIITPEVVHVLITGIYLPLILR